MTDLELDALEGAANGLGDKLADARLINAHQAVHCHGQPLSDGDLQFLKTAGPTVLALVAEVRRLQTDAAQAPAPAREKIR